MPIVTSVDRSLGTTEAERRRHVVVMNLRDMDEGWIQSFISIRVYVYSRCACGWYEMGR